MQVPPRFFLIHYCSDTIGVRPRRKKNREKSDTMKVFSKQRKDSLYDNKYNKNTAVFATHFGNKISRGQNV
ncbi:MAG: hypothetical protein SPJ59_04475, partial [Peptoniphilaceae bacterium]|nr:hypothetical protein [Peptoniphilaceae bacterium]